MTAVFTTFALMAGAFGVACVFQPHKGAQAAVVLALMVAAPAIGIWTLVLQRPHMAIVHTAVDFANGE